MTTNGGLTRLRDILGRIEAKDVRWAPHMFGHVTDRSSPGLAIQTHRSNGGSSEAALINSRTPSVSPLSAMGSWSRCPSCQGSAPWSTPSGPGRKSSTIRMES